jgi:hypothetical protein
MNNCIFIIFFSLFLSISAASQVVKPEPRPTRTTGSESAAEKDVVLSSEDALREIVFIHILKPWIAKTEEGFFCLGVDVNQDLSKSLLKRLQRQTSKIRNDSSCLISDDSTVVDVESGKRGVRFSISKIKWVSETEAKVEAGSYVGNMGSDGCLYSLKKEKGEWRIVKEENCWIS